MSNDATPNPTRDNDHAIALGRFALARELAKVTDLAVLSHLLELLGCTQADVEAHNVAMGERQAARARRIVLDADAADRMAIVAAVAEYERAGGWREPGGSCLNASALAAIAVEWMGITRGHGR
jgi:hypothetical protein